MGTRRVYLSFFKLAAVSPRSFFSASRSSELDFSDLKTDARFFGQLGGKDFLGICAFGPFPQALFNPFLLLLLPRLATKESSPADADLLSFFSPFGLEAFFFFRRRALRPPGSTNRFPSCSLYE